MNTANSTDNIGVYVQLANSTHFKILSLQRHKTVFYSKSCLETPCQSITEYLLTDGKNLCSPAKGLSRMRAAYGISPPWPPNSTSVCSYSCTTRVSVSECKPHKPPGKPFGWNCSRESHFSSIKNLGGPVHDKGEQ